MNDRIYVEDQGVVRELGLTDLVVDQAKTVLKKMRAKSEALRRFHGE